ncbi:MAG: hypothetical protein AB7O32_09385, partial [Vicinamibacterales bacterium]
MIALAVLAVAAAGQGPTVRRTMNEIAEEYVRLVLAVGRHDADYVDAFYGPAEWKEAAARDERPLERLSSDAGALLDRLGRLRPEALDDADPLVRLRYEYLRRQLESLRARVGMLRGGRLTFDEESKALYDAVAPAHPASYYEAALRELEPLLPGDGPIVDRYERFRAAYVISPDRLSRVFDRAIAECRGRTAAHIPLPAGESFRVEYVTGKSWSGYNWYQGQYHSLIQVNTDLPIYI